MKRNDPMTDSTRTVADERFVARSRSWLRTQPMTVALDPARWSERHRQIAFWGLCETWLANRPVH